MALRVTATPIEVLRNANPNVLVTGSYVEVLRNANPNVRVTGSYIEVLRSSTIQSNVINLSPGCGGGNVVPGYYGF